MDHWQKFVRFWQLLDVLGSVVPMTCCLSVVTRGRDFQDEKGPVFVFRELRQKAGQARKLGKTMLFSKLSWGGKSLGMGIVRGGLDPERLSGEPASIRLRIVRDVSQVLQEMDYCPTMGI